MSKLIDLTGQRFGRLVVLERGDDYVSPPDLYDGSVQRRVQWICKCDCGNTTLVWSESLKNGRTRSCGCLRKEVSRDLADKNRKRKDNNV